MSARPDLTGAARGNMIARVILMSKMIGILGGLGPKAGEGLHAAILGNTRAICDPDHLQILLYTNPHIPDRTDFLLGRISENPAGEMLRSLQLLVQFGAGVCCVPCNTATCPPIWDVVEEGFAQFANGAELLNIVHLTAAFVTRTHPSVSHVGILATDGTIQTEVYQRALGHHNVKAVLPTATNQKLVQGAIYHPEWGIKAKSAPVTQQARDALEAAALRLIADGAEAVILGCTEIPLAFDDTHLKGIPLINSTAVLARECIRRAAGEDKLVPLKR